MLGTVRKGASAVWNKVTADHPEPLPIDKVRGRGRGRGKKPAEAKRDSSVTSACSLLRRVLSPAPLRRHRPEQAQFYLLFLLRSPSFPCLFLFFSLQHRVRRHPTMGRYIALLLPPFISFFFFACFSPHLATLPRTSGQQAEPGQTPNRHTHRTGERERCRFVSPSLVTAASAGEAPELSFTT